MDRSNRERITEERRDDQIMDVKDAIGKRRSIRQYENKAVPPNVIGEVLDAARRAPSGCNAQPWRFVVVQDRETIEVLKLHDAFPQSFVYSAPVIVVCCGDPAAYAGKYGGENQVAEGTIPEDAEQRKAMFGVVEGKSVVRTIRDVSIASAFMVLRATELGLGTSYIGLINEEALHTVLAIPEDLLVLFVVLMGYTAYTPLDTPRRDLNDIMIGPAELRD
jgi:nitroreductase